MNGSTSSSEQVLHVLFIKQSKFEDQSFGKSRTVVAGMSEATEQRGEVLSLKLQFGAA